MLILTKFISEGDHLPYSKNSPSERYKFLGKMYQDMHINGDKLNNIEAKSTFSGSSLLFQAQYIKRLIAHFGISELLDYGSGKGKHYISPTTIQGQTYQNIQSYWDIEDVDCYDPYYQPFSTLREKKYGGVICTDVLEHINEEDIPWILEDIFTHASQFVFANVACFLAQKKLPNGENAHCTIKNVEWWTQLLNTIAKTKQINYIFTFTAPIKTGRSIHIHSSMKMETLKEVFQT